MSNLLSDILKTSNNEYAAVAEDGIQAGDVTGFISTGSYSLNALLSGSPFKGLPANKVTALAGEPSTGKTFFAINIIKQFLIDNPKGIVCYFESESAISKEMLTARDVDVARVVIFPVATIQEFRTQAIKLLNMYLEKKEEDRDPMFFVLDSLGNLSTDKEVEDIAEGKDTRDMTRAQLIRGAFRVLTLKLGKANVPLLVTNHVYDVVGSYIPMKKMGGGSGLEYAASTIIFLSKKKAEKDKDGDIPGAVVTAVLKKSRLSIENKKVETLLDYETGLNPYYGLIELAEKFGIFTKVGNKYEVPSGDKVFESAIKKNPEKYFTIEVMAALEEKCEAEFLYGRTSIMNVEKEKENV